MSTVIVAGAQYGDEGKGCITDLMAKNADMVVRYNGGNNAGHTIVVGDKEYKLHLIPSGILHKGVKCVLGNGVIINPLKMMKEIDKLEKGGISTENLFISDRAHIIMPTHEIRDRRSERDKKEKIGTTGRGIGPTFMDKASRVGIRMGDLVLPSERLYELIVRNLKENNITFQGTEVSGLVGDYKDIALPKLGSKIIDTSQYINDCISTGFNVLFEGAQGTLIDIDHGTYPFVTSSNSCAGGVCTGAGVGPTKINKVIGVAKAYTTRVGEGPFPTELHSEIGDKLRENGNEFGTTTGRPRRCGWLDLVALRYAIRVNGINTIALTKLDVLSGIDDIYMCINYYGLAGDAYLPPTSDEMNIIKPTYIKMKGWTEDISNVRSYYDLPEQAREYVERIAHELGVHVCLIGVGPERDQTIVMEDLWR